MNPSPISSTNPVATANIAAMLRYGPASGLGGAPASARSAQPADPAAVKKAAAQFEAIILRQLLTPAIEPVMTGGLGGSASAGSGGSMYAYMLTDTLANSLAQGRGLGLAAMLEKQFSPPAPTKTTQPT